tara:strand:- start:1152 stop:1580 length:429 start_codon:yes stop_codon:yes gene_type:complete
MEIKNIFVSIVLLSMVSIGLFSFMGDMIDNNIEYGTEPVNGNYSAAFNEFNVLDNLDNTSKSIYNNLNVDEKPDKLQFFILAPALVWNIFKIILTLPLTILDLVGNMATLVGVPSWVLTGFTAILMGVFGFLALYALIKWKM